MCSVILPQKVKMKKKANSVADMALHGAPTSSRHMVDGVNIVVMHVLNVYGSVSLLLKVSSQNKPP